MFSRNMAARFALVFFASSVSLGCSDEAAEPLPVTNPNQGIKDPVTGEVPAGFTEFNLVLKPTFPDQDTLDATKQYGVVLRAKLPGDCDALWDTTPSGYREGGGLIDAATSTGSGISPISKGEVTVFLYAYDKAFDLLCHTDKWCESSRSGSKCLAAPSGVKLCAESTPKPLVGWCASATIAGTRVEVTFKTSSMPPTQLTPDAGQQDLVSADTMADLGADVSQATPDAGPD